MKDDEEKALKRKRGPNGGQDKINQRLRRGILSGEFPPGSRLPTHSELRRIFKSSPCTVQCALDRLVEEGFARTEWPRGTFVSENPPCLSNYAIVFPAQKREISGMSFWKVLANLAEKEGVCGPDRRFSLYFGLNGHTDEPGYGRLLEDVRETRLAGIIFGANPFMLLRTSLFDEIMGIKELPKAAFMSEHAYPDIPAVYNDYEEVLRKSLDHLQSLKCRRLAVIHIAGCEGSEIVFKSEKRMIAEAAKRGMLAHPWWIQGVHAGAVSCARKLVRLLLQGPGEERPDAILITDDSLVEPATQGIVDAGLGSPADIQVAALCNFPEPPMAAVPVKFFGMNVAVFIDTCMDLMERRRRRLDVRPMTVLPCETVGMNA